MDFVTAVAYHFCLASPAAFTQLRIRVLALVLYCILPEEDCVGWARLALAEEGRVPLRTVSVPGGRLPRFAFLSLFRIAACDATAGAEVFLDKPWVRTQGKGASDEHCEQCDNSNLHFGL